MPSVVRAIPVLFLGLLLAPVSGLARGEGQSTKSADAALRREVNDAIDRGAKWLAKQQDWDGSFGGVYASSYPLGSNSLAVLALLNSGVPPSDDSLHRAVNWLRVEYRKLAQQDSGARISPLRTYSVSVTLMVVAELARAGGGPGNLPEADRKWLQELTDWLVEHRSPGGAWRYPQGDYDTSNTQYALLALKEARRAGAKVPDAVFAKALAFLLSRQEPDGPDVPRFREKGGDGIYSASRERESGHDRARGWGYVGPQGATGSMTAAGTAAIAICVSELGDPKYRPLVARGRAGVRDGLAWLGKHFTVAQNPPLGPSWHYYYLYGLERAGVLGGVVFLGRHRWYAEGARFLVDHQDRDGAWRPGVPVRGRARAVPANVVEQSFALLFLARATARGTGVATKRVLADLTRGADLGDADLRALFDAAFAEMADLDAEPARDRAAEFSFLGPRVIPLLIRRLAAADFAERARAGQILRRITGEKQGFDASAPAAERDAAADRWTTWYFEHRDSLSLDRPARLLR